VAFRRKPNVVCMFGYSDLDILHHYLRIGANEEIFNADRQNLIII
jgi:hypothetical protein